MREMITQPADRQAEYRKLPAVDALLRVPAVAVLAAEYGDALTAEAARAVLAAARGGCRRRAGARNRRVA